MRVVVAPDCFGGTMTATEAAGAIAAGWRDVAPADELALRPMSDGGPGFVDVLSTCVPGAVRRELEVPDPLGRPVPAAYVVAGDSAYVESAQACGLHLLHHDERDPWHATTRGVGRLLRAAAAEEVRRVVVGLGGSATNDGGAGLWEELGDAARLGAVELVAATDVDNPLLGPNGASAVYGPQKGADRAMVLDLDDRLRGWADRLEAQVGRPGLRDERGAGAAGGLGFALLALGARRRSGFAVVAEAVALADALADAQVVVTGEGSFDSQSLRGKVPAGVARLAQDAGVPCVVLAGTAAVGRRDAAAAGVEEIHTVAALLGSVHAALAAGPAGLRQLAAAVARAWSRAG